MFVANWRTDWQRGPSVPSMLSGRPIVSALISCFFASSASAARSTASLPRFSVVSGVASMRKASDVATPMVLVPTSSAIRRQVGTSVFNSAKSTTAIASGRLAVKPGDRVLGNALPAGLSRYPVGLSGILDIVRDMAEALGRTAHDSGRRELVLLGRHEQQRHRHQPR